MEIKTQADRFNYILEPDRTPPNSSDEEVQEQFEESLMQIMMASLPGLKKQPDAALTTGPSADDTFKNKPYKYPRIIWDQTKKRVTIKLILRNVKEMNIEYGNSSVSFR